MTATMLDFNAGLSGATAEREVFQPLGANRPARGAARSGCCCDPADLREPAKFDPPGSTDRPRPTMAEQNQNSLAMQLLSLIAQLLGMSTEHGNQDSSSTGSPQSSAGKAGAVRSNRPATPDGPATAGRHDLAPAPNDARSNPRMQKLAQVAESNARANGTTGWCLREVNDSLETSGFNIRRQPSAYMAADELARHPDFHEVQPPSDLRSLPAGAVVVWDKGPGKPDGHISIALGNGKEASDHIQNQITNYGTSVRVFFPA